MKTFNPIFQNKTLFQRVFSVGKSFPHHCIPVPSTTWPRTGETKQSTIYLTDFDFSWPLDKTFHFLQRHDLHQLIHDA